jgi:predicted Ser/Thr protein kinase
VIGQTIGSYRITAKLGEGGMGEVYRAHDPRLGRDVAIKFLKEQFTERFEREARAVAAVNHPNICTLHDVGPNYLVMEYIEGIPLKGPLPLDQALRYAAQICDALDAAHRKGITHRDLKPANILVTKAGVKLVDFGLARVGPAVHANEALTGMAITGEREILGTLYYMAPEQLEGKAADARSDIFSFGLVFYEMLTGKRAFDGASPASVIAAILERPAPSVSEVAPAALDQVIGQCLQKDPENRWQSARDLRSALLLVQSSSPPAGPVPGATRPALWMAATVTAVLIAALALWAVWRKPTPAPPGTASIFPGRSPGHQFCSAVFRLGNLPRRTPAGSLRPEKRRRSPNAVAAKNGFARLTGIARNRKCQRLVLVARFQVDRFHCGRKTEAYRRDRWSPAGSV